MRVCVRVQDQVLSKVEECQLAGAGVKKAAQDHALPAQWHPGDLGELQQGALAVLHAMLV